MTQFNRNTALKTVKSQRSWKIVKNWIKDMVNREPTIMRRVARAKFGDLATWLDNGAENVNEACGCLVGTTAIELIKARNSLVIENTAQYGVQIVRSPDKGLDSAIGVPTVISELCRVDPKFVERLKAQADEAGSAASDLKDAFERDMPEFKTWTEEEDWKNTQAVLLIKSEIKLQLRRRSARIKAAKASKTRSKKSK